MNQQDALKLLEISTQLAREAMQAKVAANGSGQLTETELKNLFVACVDMAYEKFQALPTIEQQVDEKFATIAEMHHIFAEKFAELDRKNEKFATIGEMHRIFAEKFAELDRKEEKFATIGEMHRIFAEKFAEIDYKDEKFATISEMHRIFAEKFSEVDRKEERFATISEMHRIFAEKFVEIDRKLAAIPLPRASRRPG